MGPSFVAAVIAAVGLGIGEAAPCAAWIIVSSSAAAGGALFALGTVFRQPTLRAGAAAAMLGALLAATGMVRMSAQERSAYLGIATPGPLVLHGAVLDDGRPQSRGGTMLPLQVVAASSLDGALRATADIRVDLLLRGAEARHRGEVLSVTVGSPPAPQHGRRIARAVQVERHGYRSALWRLRAAVRERVSAALARAGPAAGLATAVLLGDRRHLEGAAVARFRRAGASHLLALSGLHVGIVYGCALLLLRAAPRRAGPMIAAVIAALYALIATGGPALARAAVMAAIGSLLAVTDRERRPVPVVGLAALILLVLDPAAARQLSFQLSFLALLGVLAGARVAQRMPSGVLRYLGGAVVCSIGAQLATAPLVLTTFGALYPGSVLLAPVLMPTVTVFLIAALGVGLSGQVAGVSPSGIAGAVLNLAYIILETGIALSAAIPGISL